MTTELTPRPTSFHHSAADVLPKGWVVEPLSASIGAIIHGVDLTRPLSEAEVGALRSALLGRRVIFFRNQHLSPAEQVEFARRFGTLTPAHPLVGGLDADHPEVLELDSENYPLGVGQRGNGTSYNTRWDTDVTFSATPPAIAFLAAKVIPPSGGGDTLWADLIGAYETLSPPLQHLLDGLVAVHDANATFSRFRADDPTGEQRAKLARLDPVQHPVVRVHPETGARGLFVNETFTATIEGLGDAESRAILDLLYAHTITPERVVRWHWNAGDLAVWDNRSTVHYAAADYSERRVMHRVTVVGDRPTGIYGYAA